MLFAAPKRNARPPVFATRHGGPSSSSSSPGGMWRASLVGFTAVVALVLVVVGIDMLGPAGDPNSGGSAVRRFSARLAAATLRHRALPAPFTSESSELEGGPLDFCPALTVLHRQRAVEDSVAEVAPPRSLFHLVEPSPDGPPGACPHWTTLRYPGLLPAPVPICVHDPALDAFVSAVIVQRGGFMQRRQLSALLAAAPCTAAQPYFIDGGANVGSWALLAAVSAGCHVIAFEPLQANVDRLLASVASNNVSSRFTVFRNALGAAPASTSIEVSFGNSGGNRLADGLPPAAPEEAGGVVEGGGLPDQQQQFAGVDVVTLDDLFGLGAGTARSDDEPAAVTASRAALEAWRASLPVPLTPSTVAGAKLDLEGHDAAGLFGSASALAAAPLLFVEFEPRDIMAVSGCDPVLLLRRLWGERAGYEPGTPPHGGYDVIIDSWAGLPLPPPCLGTATHAALERLGAYAASGGVDSDGNDLESGWPSEWDELLLVRRSAPFLPALLQRLSTLGNNTWANVTEPLTACGEALPGGKQQRRRA